MTPQVSAEMKFVAKCGAIGGVVSSLYTYMAGATYGLPWWIAVPLCVPLGAVAAIIAVFYVTPTDTSKANQLVAYAMICGIMWKPVIDAGKALIAQHVEAAGSKSQTATLVAEVKNTPPAALPGRLNDIAGATARLLSASDTIDNPKLRSDATTQAKQAVAVVAAQADENPKTARVALDEINTAAKKADNPEVAQAAQTQLHTLFQPCAADITHCPPEGCGASGDPNLNRRENITDVPGTAEPQTIAWISGLPNPSTNFRSGEPRDELSRLGEGKKFRVPAYLLVARVEGPESCNCRLSDDNRANPDIAVNTDNHLVLVSAATLAKFPLTDPANGSRVFHQREAESITAEFTPRVRLAHPNFVRAKVQPLIDNAPQHALHVRVTGVLLFDSEHFLHNLLNRASNWEIHPVLELEYCPNGTTCNDNSEVGWQSLDNL